MEFYQLTADEKREAKLLAGHLILNCAECTPDRVIHLAAAVQLVTVFCLVTCKDAAGQLDLIADHLMQEATKIRERTENRHD